MSMSFEFVMRDDLDEKLLEKHLHYYWTELRVNSKPQWCGYKRCEIAIVGSYSEQNIFAMGFQVRQWILDQQTK